MTRYRGPGAGSNAGLWVVTVAAVAAAAGLGGYVWWRERGGGASPPPAQPAVTAATAAPTPAPTPSPVPKPADKETGAGPKPTPSPARPRPDPDAPFRTFDAAWVEAMAFADRLDAEEPEATRRATAVLTDVERAECEGWLAQPVGAAAVTPNVADILLRHGYRARVRRDARAVGRLQSDVRRVCAAFFDPAAPRPRQVGRVVAAVEAWGLAEPVWRGEVARAVTAGDRAALLPEARDLVLAMGGRAWLEAR